MNEKVLVFPDRTKDIMGDELYLTGVEAYNAWQSKVFHLLHYMDRQEAENDEKFKQVIPYCILRDADDKIFIYKRGKKGSEARLHDLYSIGIGGHINPHDRFSIFNCALREIREELSLEENFVISKNWFSKVGVIYDPRNAVGRVHFGAVLSLRFPFQKMSSYTSPELQDAQWVSLEEVPRFNLESWSGLAWEMLN